MFLGNALGSAASGLDSITRQLALVSQNVANAGTPNYVKQTLSLSAADAGGQTFGVLTGPATRAMDDTLQANLFAAVGTEAADTTAQDALQRIDQVSGAPGDGQSLPDLFGALQDSFSKLMNDPANGTQQREVVTQAQSLAQGVNALGSSLVQERQTAQNSLQQEATTANTALRALGTLSDQIILAQSRGESTADLEDQRDAQMQTVAQLTGAKFIKQSNGDLLAIAGSSVLPLRASSGPFSISGINFTGSTPTALIPQLMVDGAPASGIGGQMGANLTLRDTTIPAMQAGLDGFAQSLASGFNAQGLTLFTDGSGAVPASGAATGFSTTIQVSAAVAADPSMTRDGTTPSGLAGDTTLITNVLDNVFTSGATSLSGQATNLIAGYSAQASDASSTADTSTGIRSGLETKLNAETGVSVDGEMSDMIRLQSAYAANAKVVTAVQDMWNTLLQAVQ
ncbi:MAG: flagellar hook-associated protein FlgK [Acetobacteraceae bacterium]|nr:flagellar hook-associated protein FlgK [Acetobacteraceae bacterium]